MDNRRKKLISYSTGYDFGDVYSSSCRTVMARRVRKQEKAAFARDLIDRDDIYDDLDEARGFETWEYIPFWDYSDGESLGFCEDGGYWVTHTGDPSHEAGQPDAK